MSQKTNREDALKKLFMTANRKKIKELNTVQHNTQSKKMVNDTNNDHGLSLWLAARGAF